MVSHQPHIACFSLNPYKEYCGTIQEFKHTGRSVELTVEVNQETWESADLLMLFNLKLDKRYPGTISGTTPVQISMFLDRELYENLKASGNLLTDIHAFIKADPQHPMRGTASWFATEVTEEVELPGNLKKKGTIRQGFITHWKEAK